jgi:hypothetical protein
LNVKALAYLELAVSDDSKKSLNVCRFMNSVCDKLQNVKWEDFINFNCLFPIKIHYDLMKTILIRKEMKIEN